MDQHVFSTFSTLYSENVENLREKMKTPEDFFVKNSSSLLKQLKKVVRLERKSDRLHGEDER